MPHSTTGTVAMWNGTKDGEDGYIDWATKATNIKSPNLVKFVAEDIRSTSNPPTLMKDGWELVQDGTSLSQEQLFAHDTPEGKALIERVYFDEVREIISKMTPCKDFFTTKFLVRQMNHNLKDMGAGSPDAKFHPIAHVDVDAVAARESIVGQLGEETANHIMSYKNWGQINVWRPMNGQVQRWPLVFIDQSRIADWNYETHMATLTTRNDPRSTSNGVRTKVHDTLLIHDERYSYRYASDVLPQEAFVFFSFHSDPQMVVPHGAFWDDSTAKDAPGRSSIEVRTWVGYD